MDPIELARSNGHQVAIHLTDEVLRECIAMKLSADDVIARYRLICYDLLCFVLRICCMKDGCILEQTAEDQQALFELLNISEAESGTFSLRTVAYENDIFGVVLFQSSDRIEHEVTLLREHIEKRLDVLEQESGCQVVIVTSSVDMGVGSVDHMIRQLQFSTPMLLERYPELRINTRLLEADHANIDCIPQTEIERQFADSVISMNFDKALAVMETIITNEWAEPDLAMSIRARIARRLDWVLIVLRMPRTKSNMLTLKIDKYCGDIQRAESLEKLRELVRDFFHDVDDFYLSIRNSPSCHADYIADFIRTHYSDVNLSATMICNTFRLSSSYLSRMFKQKTGMKLIDFIHNVRLEEAKRLLTETDLTVSQIAARTGYASGGALTRTFRRYENMTPSELRQEHPKL